MAEVLLGQFDANNHPIPDVSIVMGSQSDWPGKMEDASGALEYFGVFHEKRIKSAHRTTEEVLEYARTAKDRGIKVIIAAAGGSAHLQAITSSNTPIPVIGVAIESSPDPMQSVWGSNLKLPKGQKLLMATHQNEKGAVNAALSAVSILGLMDPELQATYEQYMEGERQRVVLEDQTEGFIWYPEPGLK